MFKNCQKLQLCLLFYILNHVSNRSLQLDHTWCDVIRLLCSSSVNILKESSSYIRVWLQLEVFRRTVLLTRLFFSPAVKILPGTSTVSTTRWASTASSPQGSTWRWAPCRSARSASTNGRSTWWHNQPGSDLWPPPRTWRQQLEVVSVHEVYVSFKADRSAAEVTGESFKSQFGAMWRWSGGTGIIYFKDKILDVFVVCCDVCVVVDVEWNVASFLSHENDQPLIHFSFKTPETSQLFHHWIRFQLTGKLEMKVNVGFSVGWLNILTL